MGILDSIKGLVSTAEEKKSAVPFALTTTFTPFRLTSKKNDMVDLNIDIENIYGADALASITVTVSKGLGTDSTLLGREKTVKLETMKNGESRRATVQIYSASLTKPGTYKIRVEAFAHYRDYRHIENSIKKIVEIRVV